MNAIPPRANGGRTIQVRCSQFQTLAQSEQGQQLIQRFDMEPGEELGDFLDKIYMAVYKVESEDSWLWMVAIFDDHIIVEDDATGKYFRYDMARDESGDVVLSNPVEVMVQYVPVTEGVQRSVEGSSDGEGKSEQVLRCRIPDVPPKGSEGWSNILMGPNAK